MKAKELHKNFLMIHAFEHDGTGMKEWVKNATDYTGNYHNDWLHLMPVVLKVEETHSKEDGNYQYSVIIEGSSCFIMDNFGKFNVVKVFEAESKIIAVYEAVVKFIKWYNKKT